MQTTKTNNPIKFLHLISFLLLSSALYLACNSGGGGKKQNVEGVEFDPDNTPITISSDVPTDILPNDSAKNASLSQAAAFAWQEFIALNWPALTGTRDMPDPNAYFGGDNDTVLVWHTFRNKVEIYPGNGKPPPGYNPKESDLGYNTLPQYLYSQAATGNANGQVNPAGNASSNTPWVNLDENNEIGLAAMFAGVADPNIYPGQQILFLAKGNKKEYEYAVKNNFYYGHNDTTTSLGKAQNNTKNFIQANSNTPTPEQANSMGLVSFPHGTIEVKTGWRRLTAAEKQSGRFYTTKVRYYTTKNGKAAYIDDSLGMVALHIIQKTPTAPYFIFATFEQTDNLLTTKGAYVEDVNGNIIANQDSMPLNPNFKVTNATPTMLQTFSPMIANSNPGNSLYYQNVTDSGFGDSTSSGLPGGTVAINKRLHPIPPEVIAANKTAHDAISAYNKKNGIKNSPWSFYKLVNVQYKPIQKKPGVNYAGADSATYYMANSVVESDYNLQKFSGQFSTLNSDGTGDFTITDYKNTAGDTTRNAYNNGKFLMGGCMGCHGNATNGGTDYSFILGKPVTDIETASPVNPKSAKIKQFLSKPK